MIEREVTVKAHKNRNILSVYETHRGNMSKNQICIIENRQFSID